MAMKSGSQPGEQREPEDPGTESVSNLIVVIDQAVDQALAAV